MRNKRMMLRLRLLFAGKNRGERRLWYNLSDRVNKARRNVASVDTVYVNVMWRREWQQQNLWTAVYICGNAVCVIRLRMGGQRSRLSVV